MSEPGWYPDQSAQRWWDGVGWSRLARSQGALVPDGPVADPSGLPAPGWYPDPLAERWWDGATWTAQTQALDANDPSAVAQTATLLSTPERVSEPPSPIENGGTQSTVVPNGRPRRRVLLLTLAAVAALIALAGTASLVFLRDDAGEAVKPTTTPPTPTTPTTTVAAALDPPVGAVDLPTSPSHLATVSAQSATISVATCPGLLVASPADSCVQIDHDSRTYAMTLAGQDNGALIDVFEFVTSSTGLTATKMLSGTIESPELQPNSTHTISIATAPTATSPTFVVQSLIEGDSPPRGQVEFISIGGDNEVTTVGVITDDPTAVATSNGYVFVTADRYDDDACCVSASLFTTIYPVKGGWQSVAELLDPDEANRRSADLAPVTVAEPVVFRGPEPAPTTTVAPAPTTAPGVVPGQPPVDIDCDGSWLAVVASAPLVNVESGLNSNPGSRVLRTDESCLSLSPTFSSGPYAGQPIYVIFYGSFTTLFAAQEQCIDLRKYTFNVCYAAPLTNDSSDRSIRFGPYD
jgi:hypothetical protein